VLSIVSLASGHASAPRHGRWRTLFCVHPDSCHPPISISLVKLSSALASYHPTTRPFLSALENLRSHRYFVIPARATSPVFWPVKGRDSHPVSSTFIVAAIQVSYPHSPYDNPTLATHSSGAELDAIAAARAHFQHPFEFRPASPSKHHRWSRQPGHALAESIEEGRLSMSSNGSATRLPPLSSRATVSLANTSTSGQQTAPQNVPPRTQQIASDQRASVQPPPGPLVPRSPVMAENAPGPGSRPSRPLGVHSILNPTQGEESEKRGRRRSAAEMMEAPTSATTSPPTTQILSRPSSSGSDRFGPVSPTDTTGPRHGMPRRILTPLSPTIHRVASSNRLPTGPISTGTAPTGTIDAHQSPFLGEPSSTHAQPAQPGPSAFPPLNASHSVHDPTQRYSLPQATTPPLNPHPMPRRQSASSVVYSHSARASPAPTFHSYTRSGQASPAMPHYPPSSIGTPSYGQSPALGPITNVPPIDHEHEHEHEQGYGIPVASTGQSSYQLLTIDSGKGPVQFPVEVQAASRMADEKRRRNAGASARFRARRKEKEREASARISQLEQQVREALEEADWYRKERDELLGLLRTVPGGERYLAREKSPKARREEDPQRGGGTIQQQSLPQGSHYSFDRPQEPERNIRRRTESYSLPPPASSGPPAQSYYAPGPYQQEAQSSRQLTPLQPFATPSAGPSPPVPARAPEPNEQHPRAYDPSWPPRTGPPR
jgi:hypothetical protein